MAGGFARLEWDEAAFKHGLKQAGAYTDPAVRKLLQRTSKAAADQSRNRMKATAPVGPTGNLRKSIGTARIRNRPGAIGYVAAPLQRRGKINEATGKIRGAKKGYHRHLVVHGTQAHETYATSHLALRLPDGGFRRSVRHPGASGNPFVAAAYDAADADRAMQEAVEAYRKENK